MQVVGKENVARKVTVLLNTISRHCKNISGAGAQIATQPPIAAVLKRRHAILQRVLLAIDALSLSLSLSLPFSPSLSLSLYVCSIGLKYM